MDIQVENSIYTPRVSLLELCLSLSEAVDLVSNQVSRHHMQVAYISLALGREMGFSPDSQRDMVLAGILHDIGALSLQHRIDTLSFDMDDHDVHAELGYRLLQGFDPFYRIARIVKYHHHDWQRVQSEGVDAPIESQVLYLADRLAVLIKKNEDILSQVPRIMERIRQWKGEHFNPDLVEALENLSQREIFWFDAVEPRREVLNYREAGASMVNLGIEGLTSLARLFARVIDFRSRHTATHSSGVAAVAAFLSEKMGLSHLEAGLMRVAGYLHDLGKLAVPVEILDKPGPLDSRERNIVKAHPYYTYRLISQIKGLEIINHWAALHHERLDGSGFPFHLKAEAIPMGSRIMAVADVFTAITEDRPYRQGMDGKEALDTLQKMVRQHALDPSAVAVLGDNFNELNHLRMEIQSAALESYQTFGAGI